jgi:hypothetical protein
MDGRLATPPIIRTEPAAFVQHIKRLSLSKCHSSLAPFYRFENGEAFDVEIVDYH